MTDYISPELVELGRRVRIRAARFGDPDLQGIHQKHRLSVRWRHIVWLPRGYGEGRLCIMAVW